MLFAFTVILLICIVLLVSVVASGLYRETQEKELSELGVAANEIGFFLEEMQRISNLPVPLLLQSESFRSNMIGIAGLSFLGLGVVPPKAEWGSMINEARAYLQLAPWSVFVPAVAVIVTVMVFNYLGDAVRDYYDVSEAK